MDKLEILVFYLKHVLFALFTVYVLAGCSSKKQLTLMPTPVIYQESTIDPFAHLVSRHKTIKSQIFYATNRAPDTSSDTIGYGNRLESVLHLGKATIRMGEPTTEWADLYKNSLSFQRITPVPLILEKIDELAVMPVKAERSHQNLTPELQSFVDSINSELAVAVDKEIMIYVHGTKVDFANSTILTAEVDHFAGRDFVGVAFAWPSHQNIFSYLVGTDVQRALNSSASLHGLIVLLSEYTTAEHINVLSYSAGGRVTSKALFELYNSFVGLDDTVLKEKFRLGAVVFVAADVEVDIFLERLQPISKLAEQVVITVTDDDNALKTAQLFMGGSVRTGTADAEIIEEAFLLSNDFRNVEIIDVSAGKEERGFDIVGHHYWYRHPWMSSDIIFLMRTDLPPSRRGLSSAEVEGIWYLSPDYPEKIKRAAEIELDGQW
jgi:esterase/lipase superfamily enzyme